MGSPDFTLCLISFHISYLFQGTIFPMVLHIIMYTLLSFMYNEQSLLKFKFLFPCLLAECRNFSRIKIKKIYSLIPYILSFYQKPYCTFKITIATRIPLKYNHFKNYMNSLHICTILTFCDLQIIIKSEMYVHLYSPYHITSVNSQ